MLILESIKKCGGSRRCAFGFVSIVAGDAGIFPRTSRHSAAKYHAFTSVVAGTTLGMMIVNVPTILFAERATKWIPVKVVRVVAAIIYAILGVRTFTGYSQMGL